MSNGLGVCHPSSHALTAHVRLHRHASSWMMSSHASRYHTVRARLHTHHAHLLGRARNTWMHLHRLAHMLTLRRHPWVTVSHAWVSASRRGLIRGHHLAMLLVSVRAATVWVGMDMCASGCAKSRGVAELRRRPVMGRAAGSRPGRQYI